MTALYSIPALVLLLIAIVVAVAFAGGGQLYLHRRFRDADFVQHNEVGGFIISVVGTLFAVVLGFHTLVIWQSYAASQDLVALESAAAADTWHAAVGLPRAVQRRVRGDVTRYAQIIIADEWPAMRHGSFTPSADLVVMDAIGAAGSFTPTNDRESNAQSATLQQLMLLHDDRQRRLAMNQQGVSWFEWLVLFIGALCVICFCWLFGLKNKRTHALMTSVVAVIIVSMLVLLFEMQYPFRSNVSIGPGDWVGLQNHIRLMQAGTQMNMRM